MIHASMGALGSVLAVKQNIFLIGMPGSGKSAVGRALASHLGWRHRDTDDMIVQSTGVPITTIFDVEGEAGFRVRENQTLLAAASESHCVISTGGGAVLLPANRTIMQSNGTVIYLNAPLAILRRRTRHDKSRPLLVGTDANGALARLYEERTPLYESVADLIINVSNATHPQSLAKDLEQRLQSRVAWPQGQR